MSRCQVKRGERERDREREREWERVGGRERVCILRSAQFWFIILYFSTESLSHLLPHLSVKLIIIPTILVIPSTPIVSSLQLIISIVSYYLYSRMCIYTHYEHSISPIRYVHTYMYSIRHTVICGKGCPFVKAQLCATRLMLIVNIHAEMTALSFAFSFSLFCEEKLLCYGERVSKLISAPLQLHKYSAVDGIWGSISFHCSNVQ